jgi:hypothetical protein
MIISKAELIQAAYDMTDGQTDSIEDLALEQLHLLMTVTQYITDLCLNDIERRGELTFIDGAVILPYQCEHWVETILTKRQH